jgi:exosortase
MSQVLAAGETRTAAIDRVRLAVGVLAVVAVYAPVFPSLVSDWATFPSLSHGFAVPVISAWLIWARRREIADLAFTPAWSGCAIVAVGLAAYTAGAWAAEPFLARLSLPLTLMGAVLFLGGARVAREFLPGIGYLLFMIPPPYLFMKPLTDDARLVDATVTATLLPLIGVPVFQEGFLLHLPNMTLEVADVCSSIPATVALLALGAAYGYLNRRPRTIRIILLLAAVPLGIASNIFRIATTAAGAYYLGPIALHNVIHMWNGTTVFLLTFGALALLDSGLRRFWRTA